LTVTGSLAGLLSLAVTVAVAPSLTGKLIALNPTVSGRIGAVPYSVTLSM